MIGWIWLASAAFTTGVFGYAIGRGQGDKITPGMVALMAALGPLGAAFVAGGMIGEALEQKAASGRVEGGGE